MLARDVMTGDVAVCLRSDSADSAARLMWERDCGSVPVVSERRRVVGMVTDRDLCMAAYTRGMRLSEIPISTVMTEHPTTCSIDDPIEKLEAMMARAQIRRIPVTDTQGVLRGIVSLNDLARARAQSNRHDDVTETLAAIGERRGAPPPRAIL